MKKACQQIFLLTLVLLLMQCSSIGQHQWVFIGTYTQNGSYGIYSAKLNLQTGELLLADSVAAENPSYLAVHKASQRLYAVTENGGTNPGGVSSFSIDFNSGKMTPINSQPSGGDHPCYVSVNDKGTHVVVANYSGGNFSVFPLGKNGELLNAAQTIQHYGSGADKSRQSKPHMHTAIFAPKQNHIVVADLGTDYVKAYPFDPKSKVPADTSKIKFIKTEGGAGPRHIAFHPRLPVFYVMEEMSGKISVHAFNKKNIALLQTIECDRVSKAPGSADIHISGDGKFVYGSNRADANNIGIFATDVNTGRLNLVGFQSTLGTKPRNFGIDPSGSFLLAANQGTNNIVVFKRDAATGKLSETGYALNLPSPVCVVMPSPDR